jgi:hypothetical protein
MRDETLKVQAAINQAKALFDDGKIAESTSLLEIEIRQFINTFKQNAATLTPEDHKNIIEVAEQLEALQQSMPRMPDLMAPAAQVSKLYNQSQPKNSKTTFAGRWKRG